MKYHALAVLWSVLAPASAQDAEPMTDAHAALRPFVGQWSGETTSQRFELVCSGLWLKRVVGAADAISLIGVDPHAKRYVSIIASAKTAAASRAEGSFDAATKTWTWRTVAGDGPTRSTWVWQDDDTLVETDYATDADGKDVESSTIIRKQPAADGAATPAPTAATAPAVARVAVAEPAGAQPLHRPMHRELGGALVGRWNATVKTTAPGAPPSEVSGTEINSAVCDGLWVWSDFTSTMLGQPFEGHALTGYDPASGEVVSYWIDSSTAALSPRTGTFDSKTRTLTATGTAYDSRGRPLPLRETAVWKDTQARSQRLQLGSGERVTTIAIAFERDLELPDHRIR